MSFWDNVTPQSVACAKDGFKEFRIGDNDAVIKSAVEKVSESGNDMLVITFENDEGAEIRHYIVEGEFKQQRLKQFCIAFGIPFGSRDINEWQGKRGIVVCKQGKQPSRDGYTYNQVSYLRPKPGANLNPPPERSQSAQQQSQGQGQAQSDDGFYDDIPF